MVGVKSTPKRKEGELVLDLVKQQVVVTRDRKPGAAVVYVQGLRADRCR